MQQIQQLQEQMLKAQEALAAEEVAGSAGGGAVKVTATGDQRLVSVSLSQELIQDGDQGLIEDLILTAVNQALEESRKLAEVKLGPLAGKGLPY
jgi:DNA-binding YbaB/EbfC family protein